ncbi:Protein serine/threonine phosphatase PrpC, regulation of stationary phase [hydrothermal vent metagenome]|uniref:Protein serine/threonine phosphatase PrpC, regulation of stationary phase n=1 Tax=hydrothermal vent metagenome TaxID=652676 RepID=A0A3B0XF65_9ZZZZ
MNKLTSVVYAGGTDIGKVRKQNEDSILMFEYAHSNVFLFLVADGVGGHKGGALASKLTVDSIKSSVEKAVLQAHSGGGYGSDWLTLTLTHAVAEANTQLILEQKKQQEFNDMATTIVAMLVHDNEIVVSHLGDSRCYKIAEKKLIQITEDHTELQKLLNQGKIDRQAFEAMPMHNIISQAVGLLSEPDISTIKLNANTKDSYLLCSDGLTDSISNAQIQHILEKNSNLENVVDELITCANDNGGADNISVILVKFETE